MKWLKINVLTIGGLLLLFSCKDGGIHSPLEKSSEKPGKVHDVSVTNKSGGATIKYTLPEDQNLLYVKAEYTITNGDKQTAKSSYYDNSLDVEGYADTMEHKVKLYAVNRSEISSDTTIATIKPKEAAIQGVYQSLTTQPAFGGINVQAKNPKKADVSVLILQKNDLGDWEANPNSVHTSVDSISYTLRGLDTLKHDFAFTVRDQYLNYTDTLFTTIRPLYEKAIPKAQYTSFRLANDAPVNGPSSVPGMWDGDIINWPRVCLTQGTYSKPAMVTFDIGEKVKVSRVQIWDYPEYYNGRTYYYQGCMKHFQIWGTNNPPSNLSEGESINTDDWYLLGTYTEEKPSGLPYGQQSNEDYQAANSGFSWEADLDVPPVRYLRVRNLESWAGTYPLAIAELQVYGKPAGE